MISGVLFKRSSWFRCILFGLMGLLWLGPLLRSEAVEGCLRQDAAVGPNHEVRLKMGQVVQILNQSGGRMVINVQLPDGSSGIYQIDPAAIDLTAASSPASAPRPTSPPATSTNVVSPAAPVPASNAASPASLPADATASKADPNFPEDKVTLVHVTLAEDAKLPPPYSDEDSAKAGAYSYNLYLPPGYYAQAPARFPALFIMSPEGNASLGTFAQRAREEGWIVVMLVEAKNGDWGPIYGDMLATSADVTARSLRIQEGLQFATGFSGGARGTSMMSQFVPGFDGELLQGAGFAFDDRGYHLAALPHDHPYAIFMTMGTSDSNSKEVAQMKEGVRGIPFKAVNFEGGHQWAPEDKFNEGLDWLIMQAFNGDSVPDDLRQCGTQQFKFLAGRWNAEPDAAIKADQATALASFGEKLNLPANSSDEATLKTVKNAVPFSP